MKQSNFRRGDLLIDKCLIFKEGNPKTAVIVLQRAQSYVTSHMELPLSLYNGYNYFHIYIKEINET